MLTDSTLHYQGLPNLLQTSPTETHEGILGSLNRSSVCSASCGRNNSDASGAERMGFMQTVDLFGSDPWRL